MSDKYPPTRVEANLYHRELSFANSCLGATLYKKLIDCLADYGQLTEYDSTKTYAANDRAIYYGSVVESVVNNNTAEPCEDTDGSSWVVANKFKTEVPCYEDLWNYHLRTYLAFWCVIPSLTYSTYNISAKGATKYFDEGSGIGSASRGELSSVRDQILNDSELILENMKYYMKTETTCSDFATAPLVTGCDDNCNTQRRGRRRLVIKR